MFRMSLALILAAVATAGLSAAPTNEPVSDSTWIPQSNLYTRMLLDIQLAHSPEEGSQEGATQFDTLVSTPTRLDQLLERRQLEAVVSKLRVAQTHETDPNVQEDLQILLKALDLQFRTEDFALEHEVPFNNASEMIFQGLRVLLDDQVEPSRRQAAVTRLRKYTGTEAGFRPFTTLLMERANQQIKKRGVIFPSKNQLETELGRNANYLDGIAKLFEKFQLTGWQPAYKKLRMQLMRYDAWVRGTILSKAREDFRLPPARYALALEGYGIDIRPDELAAQAHAAFIQYQAEMSALAAQVAQANGYASSDYRDVILELKRKQITGDDILPFYERRLHEIEAILVERQIVTLPVRPAIIRLATAAETAQQPAPHMSPPALLHNTGQRGEFVLPLNIPSANSASEDKYDDFTFDAIAWTMIAHEARPGHELQFDSLVEHGVSLARAHYAFNSTNVEGWGLYSEYIMQPFEPVAGQLLTLQLRLLRAARAFLDPELQSGIVTPTQAYDVLEKQVMLSHAFAKEEVERFTFRMPGQANSYFYGYTKLLGLRQEVEATLGSRFEQRKFHDFILEQGLLPPDLMRKKVLHEFLPSQP
jgi:uncharacterized protein (DUF885 family)